jgi:acetyl esterase/lipase
MLADSGYATWNVEYRRYDHPGGGYPGTFVDIANAIDHLRVIARTNNIDTARVIVIGHSAGGQLALWSASRSRLARDNELRTTSSPLAVHAVVAMGPITDLREFQARQLRSCGNPGVESLLGGLPDSVPARLANTSPIERVPLRIPVTLIAGERDMIAPESSLNAYANAARARGDSVSMARIPAEGHFEVMAPGRAGAHAVLQAVRRMLTSPH